LVPPKTEEYLLGQGLHQLPGCLGGFADRGTGDCVNAVALGHATHGATQGAGQRLPEDAVAAASSATHELGGGFAGQAGHKERGLHLDGV